MFWIKKESRKERVYEGGGKIHRDDDDFDDDYHYHYHNYHCYYCHYSLLFIILKYYMLCINA